MPPYAKPFDGMPRHQLEALATSQQERIAELTALANSRAPDVVAMHDNLTATQNRCTELLLENRELKKDKGIVLPGWTCPKCKGFNGEARTFGGKPVLLMTCRAPGCDEPRPP